MLNLCCRVDSKQVGPKVAVFSSFSKQNKGDPGTRKSSKTAKKGNNPKTTIDFRYVRGVDLYTPHLTSCSHDIPTGRRENVQNRAMLDLNGSKSVNTRLRFGIERSHFVQTFFSSSSSALHLSDDPNFVIVVDTGIPKRFHAHDDTEIWGKVY